MPHSSWFAMEALADKEQEFQDQCDAGDVRGCHSLGELLHLVKHDDAGALRLFRRGCDPPPDAKHRRYAPSCFSVASMLMPSQDSGGFFDKAGSAGSIEGCANLSIIYQRGLAGVAPDADRALLFGDRACAGGDGKSCFHAAAARQRAGVDAEASLRGFERACLLGFPWGCSNAYVMLTRGDGVAVDAERAARLKETGESLSRSLGLRIV